MGQNWLPGWSLLLVLQDAMRTLGGHLHAGLPLGRAPFPRSKLELSKAPARPPALNGAPTATRCPAALGQAWRDLISGPIGRRFVRRQRGGRRARAAPHTRATVGGPPTEMRPRSRRLQWPLCVQSSHGGTSEKSSRIVRPAGGPARGSPLVVVAAGAPR